MAEIKTTDRNSEETTRNKVNQKELPQLKKYSTSFTKLKQNSEQKVLENQKKKYCLGRSHLIYYQARASSQFCLFVLRVI